MRIGLIGGLSRNVRRLEEEARSAGYELEVHDGNAGGRGSDAVRRVVARADVVVIATDLNSHRGVLVAKSEATRLGKPFFLVRGMSFAKLPALLSGLAAASAA